MNLILLKKELRQLVPLAVLLFVFICSDIVYRLIDGRLDESSWSRISGYLLPGEGAGLGGFYVFFCLMMAFSLFPREHDEGTIDFLYSLPVQRGSVFFAKFTAAFLILEGTELLGQFLDWALQLFNHQAFSGNQFQLQIAATAGFLLSSFIFIGLAHGVFFSFFRSFGLIFFGLYWWIISTLEKSFPAVAYLNFMNIVSMEYRGQTLLVPWRLLIINLGLAGISLLLAAFLWVTPAETFSTWYQRLSQKRWGRILRSASVVFAVLLLTAIMIRLMDNQESANPPPVKFDAYESATFSTAHYRFTYPLNLRESTHLIIKEADGVYETTRHILSAAPTQPIVVDLTGKSTEYAGLAGWHKIRMDIRGDGDLNSRLRILSHETSHVFALLESNRKIGDNHNATCFFNEGLAEAVSYQAYPDKEKLKAQRLLAVTAWQRHEITFNDLADRALFIKKHNEYLFYAVGETWVHALSRVCGENAPGNILRVMGRPDAPRNLNGRAFWQDALQAMNCDLEKVNGFWLKQFTDMSKERKDEIDRLPRISGGVAGRKGKNLILIATADRPVPDKNVIFVARYRNSPDDDEETIDQVFGHVAPDKEPVEIVFSIPASALTGRRFEYQFGYRFNRKAYPYFEEWQSGEKD